VERMNGLDAFFLAAETPTMPLHVTVALVLGQGSSASDRAGADGAQEPPFATIGRLVGRRIGGAPELRRRAVPVPFGLDHPVWVDDPEFRLGDHLHRARLPRPCGPRELGALMADMAARPLDRARPLWELTVVDGLDAGHVVVVPKVHHAVADGILGTRILGTFLDAEPGSETPVDARVPGQEDDDDEPGGRLPQEHELVLGSLADALRAPDQVVAALAGSASALRRLTLHHQRSRSASEGAPPPGPFSAPPCSISATISAQRTFAFAELAMDDIGAVRRGFGGTVNDVVLTLVGGALRYLLAQRGEPLDRSLVAMVPRSLRPDSAPSEAGDAGNRLSAMLVSLGSAVADPVVRLRVVSASARLGKEQSALVPDPVVQGWARLAVPAWTARAARLMGNLRLFDRVRPPFNVVVSNVRGPEAPVWLAGRQVAAVYPSGPIAEGAGVNVTSVSYAGTMFVGVTACRRLVPDPWLVADQMREELSRLAKAADRVADWCP
jgi:diacylglycerol O-acyltransferase / wax synthase